MNIISIDGGGVRSIVPATLLQRLSDMHKPIFSSCDLFSGTSAGGIIALAAATGRSSSEIVNFTANMSSKVFKPSLARKITSGLGLIHSKHSNEVLKSSLYDLFGHLRLGDLKKLVLIPSFDLDDNGVWRPKFFHNGEGGDLDMKVLDVALATSAAPGYFPTHNGFVDGGVICNNPAMASLAFSLKHSASLGQISLLSLGAAAPLCRVGGNNSWGFLRWGKPLLDILINASGDVPDYQCRQLLEDKYFRLDPRPKAGEDIALDGAGKMGRLIEIALNADISQAAIFVQKNFTGRS